MQALEVLRNGQPLVIAGAPNALLISMHLNILANGVDAATLHVSGMRDLGSDRQSHMQWLEELALANGDEIRVALINVDQATSPAEDVAADSEEHVAAQACYRAELASNPHRPSRLERLRPDASLELVVGERAPIVAGFEGDRELLSLGVTWNSWHPERLRASLTSSSCAEAIARQGGKDWFKGHVGPGNVLLVRVGR